MGKVSPHCKYLQLWQSHSLELINLIALCLVFSFDSCKMRLSSLLKVPVATLLQYAHVRTGSTAVCMRLEDFGCLLVLHKDSKSWSRTKSIVYVIVIIASAIQALAAEYALNTRSRHVVPMHIALRTVTSIGLFLYTW
jgi:hypothetical protein